GTYVPTMAAGVVTDVDGNTNLANSSNFDNSVLYSNPANLLISDAEVVEGGTLQFIASLSNATGQAVTFNYQSYNGGTTYDIASSASDYTAVSGTGTIALGQTAITIPVVTAADTTYEGLEGLVVTISSASGATITDDTGLGYIDNDDCPTTGWCQQAYLKGA